MLEPTNALIVLHPSWNSPNSEPTSTLLIRKNVGSVQNVRNGFHRHSIFPSISSPIYLFIYCHIGAQNSGKLYHRHSKMLKKYIQLSQFEYSVKLNISNYKY